MKNLQLDEIITTDGLVHQGIYFEPPKKTDIGILWIHGLTSAFFHNLPMADAVVKMCDKNGFGYASFNNRGHDIITGIDKQVGKNEFKKVSGGAGMEKFEDCIYDIDAGISFLIKKGIKKVVLIGHSTGALKAGYYGGVKKDKRVQGIIAASPVSDRLIEVKTNPKLTQNLHKMAHMIDIGKGDYILNNLFVFPVTPKRYVSLFGEKSAEETIFDYGSKKPNLKIIQNIKTPLMVVLAEKDEYADRPVGEIKDFFDKYQKSDNYKSVIIKNAVHGFDGLENNFVKVVFNWINMFKS